MKGCRPLTDGEVARIVGKFAGKYAKRDRALFVLGVKTGFRVSEMLSLTVGDVSPAVGKIVAPILEGLPTELAGVLSYGTHGKITVERRSMKGKIEGRTVVLHPVAKAALSEWVADLRGWDLGAENSPLFLSRAGAGTPRQRAITRVQAWRILHATFKAAGVAGQTGTHCMRKTFANKVYDALDKSLIKTQKALGHKNIGSTAQYLSFRESEIDAAILST